MHCSLWRPSSSFPRLLSDFHEHHGKRLLCHCSTGAPCHGDALIQAVSEFTLDQPDFDTTIMVGIYRDPAQFTVAALGLRHPFEEHFCQQGLQQSIVFRMQNSTQTVIEHRKRPALLDQPRPHLVRPRGRPPQQDERQRQGHYGLEGNPALQRNADCVLLPLPPTCSSTTCRPASPLQVSSP